MSEKYKILSLYEQALVEKKRRDIKRNKNAFRRNVEYAVQLMMILPAIVWKEKQRAFINAKQFIKWYLGGYKSGKSFTGVSYLIWLAYVNRPYAGILVHPTEAGISTTIEPLIEEICELNSIEFEIKTYKTRRKLILKFGTDKKDWGNIWLSSGDVPKSLKGPKLAFGMIDEPFIMDKEICSVVQSRIVDARAKIWQLIYTGTPEPIHMKWGFDIVDKKYRDDDEMFITTVSTREVKEYLRPGYIEDYEKNNTPEEVLTYIDGEYRNISQGAVYYSFKNKVNIYDDATDTSRDTILEKCGKRIELVLGFDFNVKQMSASLWKRYSIYKDQIREYRIQSTSDTEELAELAVIGMMNDGLLVEGSNGKYETKWGRSLIITGDASGNSKSSKSKKSDYDIIASVMRRYNVRASFNLVKDNAAVRDRTNYMNVEFHKATARIDKNCTLSIRDRELTCWKMGATGFVIDKSKTEISHLSDAGDYAIYYTMALDMQSEGGSGVKVYQRESRR